MKICISNDYEAMSKKSADDLLKYIQHVKEPLICTASGDTPKGLYKQLIQKIKQDNIDISRWNFLALDEWAGMNGNDEGSCRYHLNKDLFGPLHVNETNIIFFDGRATNPEAECEKIEYSIINKGGIDAAILGIGMNGHIGMNEPGTNKALASHVADIAESTSETGQKYFSAKQKLTHGLTLGIATLMNAKFLMLLANGIKKAGIIQETLEGEITPQLPATLLLNHKKFTVYLDKDAASNLKK